MSVADSILRGVKAGLVAGLVFGAFVALVANPLVAYADGLHHDGPGHDAEAEHASVVSTGVTTTVSVLSGVLWGVLLGGAVFGFGFFLLEPAIPGTGAAKSHLLGVAGFVTVSGAPWLVLPPAPPGAEQSLATDPRLLLYGGMVAAGAVTCLLAGAAYNRIARSHGRTVAALAALVPFAILAGVSLLAPTNAVSGALAPELRAGLTGSSVFGQLLLWGVLAAAHSRIATNPQAGHRHATVRHESTAVGE